MEPWPADRTNRSRSGQSGSAGSNFICRVHSTVAASAIPMGMPGWPDLAASTASMDRARMALASGLMSAGSIAGRVISLMGLASKNAQQSAPDVDRHSV